MVYLVRHAHAGEKAQWPGPDLARPLSAQGHEEALGLIGQLRGQVIAKVYDELRAGGIELSDPPRWPKGSTWVLSLDGGGGWRGGHLEPPVAEPEAQDQLPRRAGSEEDGR